MAELGGMLAAAILKVVGDQIGSAIGGQIKLQKNFDADLTKMKMALESIEAVLKAAERRSITDEPTRLWLKRLTDAMYDISNMVDEFEAHTQAITPTQPSTWKLSLKKHLLRFVSCLLIGPKITMANQMKKVRYELREITDNHQSFILTADNNDIQLSVTNIRETTSTMGAKEHIVGRTYETEKILACLSERMTKEFTVLPIYGIGGLGKTTLAKIIFNNSQFRGYSQVWIYVSHAFDLKKIGNSIISQLSKEKSQYTEMQVIHNSLRELLANKKIMIVLDDLWEDNKYHLDELMDMLQVGESARVVVIVTTRSEDIAIKIATTQPHKLASLTDQMCWTIIKQKSAFELRNEQEELEQIGKDISSKCGGVALAARSLGHMLHSLTFNEWDSLRNSDIWNISDSEDTSLACVLSSLRLSYSVMPSVLKLCFAYCAIFPKGYKIVKDDLIQQWVSLGFIKATNMLSTWQIGDKYIRQLVGLSFLENLKSASTTVVDFENDILFTMHDLVHDLARSVMVDEILVTNNQGSTGGSCYHFALLDDCSKPLESSKIRALRFMECREIELHGAAFSSAKSMRVLDLSECSIHKLPDCIGALKQLRYLNAPGIQHATIPDSITKLSKLNYLKLHGSPTVLALPESIGDMECLEYLDMSDCSAIKKLPESFGRLKELVHLDFSHCSAVRSISEFLGSLTKLQYLNLSYCPNVGALPETLGSLSKLQYLNLSFSSCLECCMEAEVLGALTKLEYLNLSSEFCWLPKLPEALGGFIQLKYLNLSGCKHLIALPRLFGSLRNLVLLDLSHCNMADRLHEALVGLTNLQYLNLKDTRPSSLPDDLTKLRYLNLSYLRNMPGCTMFGWDRNCLINHIRSNFSGLEHLDLSGNHYIESIPESICNLRKLHTLDLSQCTKLEEIPERIGTIGSLKFLYLQGCGNISEVPSLSSSAISLPRFVVHPGNADSSSNLILLEHVDPAVLQITELENVKSAVEADRIKLMEKPMLKDLALEWTRNVERFVDDKMLLENLVPPSTLKKLEVCGYNSASFPPWLVSQVPNLEVLVLRGMANLVQWNTSYSSGEEHVIERMEIHDCPKLRMKPLLPKAKSWVITNSDDVLSSWEECTVSHNSAYSSSRVATKLAVQCCKVPMQQWRLLQLFSQFTCLSIDNFGDLTGSLQISQHLSFLKRLCLEDGYLEEMPNWIGELTSLRNLQIRGCIGLKGLNENMRQLTKLKSLQLYHCKNMVSLPYWLHELTSLKELVLGGCDVLMSLPERIQELINLQKLEISCFPELKHLVESEEGKMNLTHNQESVCVLPTSLKELIISGCDDITSLPKGFRQLTSLQKLEITRCPKLKLMDELEEGKMKVTYNQERVCVLPTSLKVFIYIGCDGINSFPEGMKQLINLQKVEVGP